jgi:hypothetical protein
MKRGRCARLLLIEGMMSRVAADQTTMIDVSFVAVLQATAPQESKVLQVAKSR